jgi:hypothetical protein
MPLHEADMTMTQSAMGHQQNPDDGLYVEFSMFAEQNKAKSLEEGRPIFDEVPYVRIMIPGDKDNIIHRKVKDSDKQRWPRQWQAFEANQEQPLEGTPLAEWPGITRAQVEELAHFGCKTVEQLAQMPDSQAGKFMGVQMLRQKAQAYLTASAANAPIQQLQAENKRLSDELEAIKDQLAEQAKPTRRKKPAEE